LHRDARRRRFNPFGVENNVDDLEPRVRAYATLG
jgi:hypothetical protein